MTGCANGCARPYVAESGFVGRSIGRYDIFVGEDSVGTRLNRRLLEALPMAALVRTLRPLLAAFREEGIRKHLAIIVNVWVLRRCARV